MLGSHISRFYVPFCVRYNLGYNKDVAKPKTEWKRGNRGDEK